MSTADDISARSIGTSVREMLLEACTPTLYRENPFRVMQLPVDASPRQVARRAEMLRMAQKYGAEQVRCAGLGGFEPEATEEAIRNALQRLQDPERRFLDEFFWFWPAVLGEGHTDTVLAMLVDGDIKGVIDAWVAGEASSANSGVAAHNLAVLAHAMALDHEHAFSHKNLNESETVHRERLWKLVFPRWRAILGRDDFWGRLTMRVGEANDPRLTPELVRCLRQSLPLALLRINAQLAVRAAEGGSESEARRHVEIIRHSGFGREAIAEALRGAVTPARQRVKAICAAAEAEAEANPQQGGEAGRRLLEQTGSALRVLDVLLGSDHAVRNDAYDQTVQSVLRCQVVFANETEDWATSLEILQLAEPLASSPALRLRIAENIRIVQRNLKNKSDFGTCFYCQQRPPDEAASVKVDIYGNVQREPVFHPIFKTLVGTRVSWQRGAIKIPRCAVCANTHSRMKGCFWFGIFLGFLLGALALCFLISGCQPYHDMGAVAVIVGVAAIGLAWFLGRWFAEVIRPPGLKYESCKERRLFVNRLLPAGWHIGTGPNE